MPKLLFDENLSEALIVAIQDLFPDSMHIRTLGLGGASDEQVWETARTFDYILVTRDIDFERLSILRGHPPKVIHLEAFNPSNTTVSRILRFHAAEIRRFAEDDDTSFLSFRIR